MKVEIVSAPSNIALIKYMGKTSNVQNLPTNSSLSYTLSHLRTYVKIKKMDDKRQDDWKPLMAEDLKSIDLSVKGKEKFLRHFFYLKEIWGVKEFYQIESANNFPSDCGLASSASSFAALTRAASSQFGVKASAVDLAMLSRRGSGSSCRSFFSPWSLWSVAQNDNGGETVGPLGIPYDELLHMVVVVDEKIKAVSSSEAHQRISTSSLFLGRPERAEKRIEELIASLNAREWKKSYQIVWDEFVDMHELFHTSEPSFRYMTDGSLRVLKKAQEFWEQYQNGPLVTMDAGANVHFLFRTEDYSLFEKLREFYSSDFQVIDSTQFKKDPSWSLYGS